MSTKLKTVARGGWLWLAVEWAGGFTLLHRQGRVGQRIRPGQRAQEQDVQQAQEAAELKPFIIYNNIFTRGRWRTEGTVVQAVSAEAACRYYAGGLCLDLDRVKALPAPERPQPGWLDQLPASQQAG